MQEIFTGGIVFSFNSGILFGLPLPPPTRKNNKLLFFLRTILKNYISYRIVRKMYKKILFSLQKVELLFFSGVCMSGSLLPPREVHQEENTYQSTFPRYTYIENIKRIFPKWVFWEAEKKLFSCHIGGGD